MEAILTRGSVLVLVQLHFIFAYTVHNCDLGLCRFDIQVSRHCKGLDEAAQGFELLSSQVQ